MLVPSLFHALTLLWISDNTATPWRNGDISSGLLTASLFFKFHIANRFLLPQLLLLSVLVFEVEGVDVSC